MARRRTAQVRESVEELEQLRDYYQGTPNAPLMQLLLLLREDQSRTIAECAEKCGISVRKAERVWKRYREGGVSGAIQANETRIRNSWVHEAPSRAINPDSLPNLNSILNQIGQILDQGPSSNWMVAFRALLYDLVPEADYIVFRCKAFADDTDGTVPYTVAHRMILPDGRIRILSENHPNSSSQQGILEDAKRLGIDLSKYDPNPHFVEIYLDSACTQVQNHRPLAQIGVFRLKSQGSIPSEAIDRLECVRPFLTSFLKRMAVKEIPLDYQPGVVEIALEKLSRSIDLTVTERRVLTLLFSGKDYQSIATAVCTSVSTVRSHIRSIYKKLDVSNKGEAFAYFLGMLDQS